jgi:hypothetical protein
LGHSRDFKSRLSWLDLNNGATLVSSLAYAYSDGLKLAGMADGLNAANNNTLWYTPANRLTGLAENEAALRSHIYDNAGNACHVPLSVANKKENW